MTKVFFENRQWRVVRHGMEAVKPAPTYEFEAERLAETTDRFGTIYYDWPVHMAEKTWVDIEAFIEAFDAALTLHAGRYSPAKDNRMALRSYGYARHLARN